MMAAVSSMRLWVVSGSPPLISFSVSPYLSTAAQPPGPGLPEQAPSVKISTSGRSAMASAVDAVRAGALDGAVEAQLAGVLERVLALDEGAVGGVQPVVEPGEQEPHRRAAGEHGQGGVLHRLELALALVGGEQRPRLGDVERPVRLEAPGVEADRDVVGEGVGAGEVEVDDAGHPVAEEEHVVGKQVGVDDAGRKPVGPLLLEDVEFAAEACVEA